jgi:hypothetical protein
LTVLFLSRHLKASTSKKKRGQFWQVTTVISKTKREGSVLQQSHNPLSTKKVPLHFEGLNKSPETAYDCQEKAYFSLPAEACLPHCLQIWVAPLKFLRSQILYHQPPYPASPSSRLVEAGQKASLEDCLMAVMKVGDRCFLQICTMTIINENLASVEREFARW